MATTTLWCAGRLAGGFLLLSVLAGSKSDAQVPLILEAGFVGGIYESGNVDFTLEFNRAPDFFSCDQYGRQGDAFQFYIATTTNIPVFYPPRPYASLIRGGEIHIGDGIIIRNDSPPDESDPNSGGWGSVRGTVPYTLDADTLTFSVPADVLNVQGTFAYSLLLTSFGAATHNPYTGDSGGPIPIPEPAAVAVMFAAAAARLVFRPTK